MLARLLLAPVLAAYLWLALGYAAATPTWNNPDEPAHYNYVAAVATSGTLPVLEPGDWDADLLERLKATRFPASEPIDRIRYEAWQTPLYYLLAAPVYRLAPAESQRARVQWLRTFGALLGALTVLVGYLVARETFTAWCAHGPPRTAELADGRPVSLAGGEGDGEGGRAASTYPTGHRSERVATGLAPPGGAGALGSGGSRAEWLALAVATTMAGVPMFTAMSAAITNDTLANLLAAVLAVVSLRLLRALPGGRGALGLGLLLGLAVLAKLTLVVFVALALLALVVPALQGQASWPGTLRRLGLAVAAAGLVLAPWLVRQGLVYGWNDLLASRRHEAVVVGQPRFPGLSAEYAWGWGTTVFHSFWAQFGWMGIPAPDRLYWIWGILSLAAALGLAVRAWRAVRQWPGWRRADPRLPWAALAGAAMFGALVGYNLTFQQAQGRYLFPALAPLAVLMVVGWSALLPHRVQPVGVLALGVGLVALNAYTLQRVLAPAFAW